MRLAARFMIYEMHYVLFAYTIVGPSIFSIASIGYVGGLIIRQFLVI